MAAGSTYTPIATYTLLGSASSYTFSSIPTTYTDLVLVMTATQGAGTSVYCQVGNGSVDTGSNYSYTGLYGSGSAAGSARASNQTGAYLGYLGSTTIYNAINHFMNYSNTTTYKTILNRKNQSDQYVEADVALWRSTAAINTIKIYPQSGNFDAGSTFTLYGIAAA